MKNKINSIIQNMCSLESPPSPELNLENDLGMDSLNLVELIILLEKEFSIQFQEDDLDPENLRFVYNIYKLVSKYIKGDNYA